MHGLRVGGARIRTSQSSPASKVRNAVKQLRSSRNGSQKEKGRGRERRKEREEKRGRGGEGERERRKEREKTH